MKNHICVIVLMFISCLNAQESFVTERITDSIFIDNDFTESYAQYLPKQFDPNILNAIVFIFDPSGIGKNGIRPFIEASEKYNYILVCSNDSKNGPYKKNFDIANRLFTAIFAKFNIDPQQIYVAGFSGGSRFSTAIAVLTNQMQAVIACGSGFPDDLNFAPYAPNFTYAGIVGDRDMNYSEMSNNKVFLDKLKFTNDLFVFDGNHRWPPSETIVEVFDWLEILAYKNGIRIKNEKAILQNYNSSLNKVNLVDDLIYKEAILRRIENAYGPFVKMDSIRSERMKLRNSTAFKSEKSALATIFEKEEQLIQKFTNRFHTDYKKPQKANLKWWDKELEKLNGISQKNKSNQNMIERLKYKLFELAYTRSNPNYFKVTEEQQGFCKSVLQMLYPERFKKN